MASIFHTIYESNDSTYSSRNFCMDFPSLDKLEIEACQFKPTKLSESLATIANLCYEGFTSIDDVPEVLTKLRNTIMELMIYCIKIERSAYDEYIQALARKMNLFMERIVLQVLKSCQAQESPTSCFYLVKATHDVVLLMYSFTNPLKLPDSLSGRGASAATEMFMSSFKIEDILEATKELHVYIMCYSVIHSSAGDPCSTHSVNNTPRKIVKDETTDIINYLAKINLVVINNCVPTVALFSYFEAMLQSHTFSLLEIEYFEEFLSHFARINRFCQLQKNTAFFDQQREQLRAPFFHMIQLNPFRKLSWCTTLQAVNYLQIFVDLYNDIYDEGLILERWCCGDTEEESTVVRRVVGDQVAQACECPQDHPPPATPEFVNFFSQSVLQETETGPELPKQRNPGGNPGGTKMEILHEQQQASGLVSADVPCTRLPNMMSPLPKSRKIFELNEEVAYELRDLRSLAEEKYRVNKVTFKEQRCFKCKYLPWHKHVYG